MKIQRKRTTTKCPVTSASVRVEAKAAFDDLTRFSETCPSSFWVFEKDLLIRIAVLGACLMRLFLTARHERLDVQAFLVGVHEKIKEITDEAQLREASFPSMSAWMRRF